MGFDVGPELEALVLLLVPGGSACPSDCLDETPRRLAAHMTSLAVLGLDASAQTPQWAGGGGGGRVVLVCRLSLGTPNES